MRKVIKVIGSFKPLTRNEWKEILQIHHAHKGALLCLCMKKEEECFLELLKRSVPSLPFLTLETQKEEEVIVLPEEDAFHIEKMYRFYRKDLVCRDRRLMSMLVKEKMSEKRFAHSLSVAETSEKLARINHYDEEKAWLAGILHDVIKEMSIEWMDRYLTYYDPEKCESPLPIRHGYAAKYFIKEAMNYYDEDVLDAIYHHSDGKSNKVLSKILYIADKREPLRKLEDGLLEISYQNLHLGFRLLKKNVEEYLKEKDGRIVA